MADALVLLCVDAQKSPRALASWSSRTRRTRALRSTTWTVGVLPAASSSVIGFASSASRERRRRVLLLTLVHCGGCCLLCAESELFGRTLRVSIAKPERPKLGANKPGTVIVLAPCWPVALYNALML